jgi:hypothetical protein
MFSYHHSLVFQTADPADVERVLAACAEALGYRRVELSDDRLAWLHRRLSWRYPSTPWALRDWRVYSVFPSEDGTTSVVMRHLRARKGGSYSEEAAEVSRCADSAVYHVWSDEGEVFGREKYRDGKLESSIETYAGGPGARMYGKDTTSAQDKRDALAEFSHPPGGCRPPLPAMCCTARQSQELIFARPEGVERLHHGEPIDDVSLLERSLTNALRAVMLGVVLPVILPIGIAVVLLCLLLGSPLILFAILRARFGMTARVR